MTDKGMPQWLKIVFAVLFLPITILWGLWVMWREHKFTQPVRIALTVGAVLLFVAAALSGTGGETSTVAEEPAADAPAAAEVEPVAYEVLGVEDLSFGATPRFEYPVVVEEEAPVEQLEALAREVTERARSEREFCALVVGLYDEAAYVGYGYTLGKAVFAPQGEWAKADTVDPGDYDEMAFSFELYDKDWSGRLTDEELEVWVAWSEEYAARNEAIDPASTEVVDEQRLAEDIGERFDMSAEQVLEIARKQSEWMFEGQ